MALKYAGNEVRHNEQILLTAAAQDERALQLGRGVLSGKIVLGATDEGVSVEEFARALLHPVIVQVTSIVETSGNELGVNLHTLCGNEFTVHLNRHDENST